MASVSVEATATALAAGQSFKIYIDDVHWISFIIRVLCVDFKITKYRQQKRTELRQAMNELREDEYTT